jgi:hypothetical protein
MAKKGLFEDYWKTMFSPSNIFDAEWRQRRDLNELQDTAAQLEGSLTQVGVANVQLRRHVEDLTTTLGVLLQYLEETGHVDAAALQQRIEAAITASHPPTTDIPDPWHAKSAAAAPPPPAVDDKPVVEATVACAKCHASVPVSRTTITERFGTVCDRCAAM